MDKSQILKKVCPIFQNDSKVSAVYLFGSRATQKAHLKSDIDLAILFEQRLPKLESYQRLEYYFVKLAKALGTDPDLVDLETVNLILLFEILREGEVLLENNRERNRDFIARKTVECIDFQFIVRLCAKGMYRKMKEKVDGQKGGTL